MSVDSISIPVEVTDIAQGSLYAADISSDEKIQQILPGIKFALFDTEAKAVAGDVVAIYLKNSLNAPQVYKLSMAYLGVEYWNMESNFQVVISCEAPDGSERHLSLPAIRVSHIHKVIGGLDYESNFIDYDHTSLAERMMTDK